MARSVVPQPGPRRRVAILLDAIEDDYQAGIVRGAASAAQHANVELICFAGGVVGDAAKDQRAQRNFLYELIDPKSFDGILALGGTLGTTLGIPAFSEWMRRFGTLPSVSIGVEVPGCHNVVVDGASGMKETVRHLIQVHEHRHLAFIRGPATSFEAEERFAAFKEVLTEFSIPIDPNLILQGTWQRESGHAAVFELFDSRGVAFQSVDVIVAANDYMALGAMDRLRERNLTVPAEIAVTGFDDIQLGQRAFTPLTTVQQPTEAMGRQGMRLLVELMAGRAQPQLTRLPTTSIHRRSCGCTRTQVLVRKRAPKAPGRRVELAIFERRVLLCAELSRSARGSLVGAGARWEERILSAVATDLQGSSDGALVYILDQIMAGLQRAGTELLGAHAMLSTLRHALHDCAAGDPDSTTRIDDLLETAREFVSEWIARGESLRRFEIADLVRGLSQVSGALLADTVGPQQRRAREDSLRRLGFTALSLGIFTEPGIASAQCEVLAGFEPTGRVHTETHFRSGALAPSGIFERDQGALLVQPLLYEGKPLGLVTCPLDSFHPNIHEQIREQFGAGLRGYRLARGQR